MPSVADFLIERLENAGVKHVSGVPGDYILTFMKKISESKIKLVTNTDESHSGFVADAYARIHGIGCVCVTYNVGALKLCNAIAGAYAEKSPVVVISGSPGMKERDEDFLLHHMVRGFDNQYNIFSNITCAAVVLDDSTKAGYKIDEALEKLKYHKQPIYIELPRDIAQQPLKYDVYRQGTPTAPETDNGILQEALKEVFLWLDEAKRPVIMAGVQIARYGLGRELVRFAEKHNIPMVTTLLSKSVVNEKHPLFLGVYAGSISSNQVSNAVENSDCLLCFGEVMSDMTVGFHRAKFSKSNTVSCSVERLRIRNHTFKNVRFSDFCSALFKSNLQKHPDVEVVKKNVEKYRPISDNRITVNRFFKKINAMLTDDMAIVADVGESLFGAFQLTVHHHHFICPAFYASMGFAIPGALGVQLARPDLRPIVLVGDGAFQMSCTELSTIVKMGLNPIVFVLNNHGYQTERLILSGEFNDISDWNYHKVTDMIGNGIGYHVFTEEELEKAIGKALQNKTLTVINVDIDVKDMSDSLKRMGELFKGMEISRKKE